MASSATITNRRIDAQGRVYISFSNGMEKEFMSLASLAEAVAEVDSDIDRTTMLAIAYFMARSPDLSNLSLVQDKAVTFDLSQNNPIRLDPNSTVTGISARAR